MWFAYQNGDQAHLGMSDRAMEGSAMSDLEPATPAKPDSSASAAGSETSASSAGSAGPVGSGVELVRSVRQVAFMMIVRGAAAIVFGVLALMWPGLTAIVLAIVFGAYALLDGIGLIFAGFRGHAGSPRWMSIAGGALGIAIGLLTLLWPVITVIVLAIMVGAWAVVTGVAEIIAAIRLRKVINGEGIIAALGIVSLVAGVLILALPFAGALGIAIIIGSYAILYGIVLIAIGMQLRKSNRDASRDASSDTDRNASHNQAEATE